MAGYDDYAVRLDAIRRSAADESEFWMARDLQPILGYERWENFAEAIKRGMDSCASSDVPVENHFREITKMMEIGKGAKRATAKK